MGPRLPETSATVGARSPGPGPGTGPATGDADEPDDPDPAGRWATATGAEPDSEAATGPAGDAAAEWPDRPVHRVRDLDRRGRLWVGAFALALLLAPALAFAWAAPDWAPANDPALMGLRALDVGSSRTPLVGQPSTTVHYVGGDQNVNHPGPLQFYLMAPAVRVAGTALGMIGVSVLIVGCCLLVTAWAVYRQLGPTAGAIAAVTLAAVTFTTGASSLVNPVSSNMTGYPLLCSMVLLWALVCGDLRLLPLTTVVVSFTAQQHLSSLPALSLAVAGTLAWLALAAWRHRHRWRQATVRRQLARWTGASVALGLVAWSPVLLDQATNGNLTMMASFARNSDRPKLGTASATRQLAHTLGLPPLLGRTRLDGGWLLTKPSMLTWLSATAVVALVAALGLGWRRSHPRRAALVLMAGMVAAGGFVNGASVPVSLEQFRIAFYHWVFPLLLLVIVALGLAVADLVRRLPLPRPAWAATALAAVAVAAVAAPSVANRSLDRPTNTFRMASSPVSRPYLEDLADQVMARRDELGGEPMILMRGGQVFDGMAEALGLMLIERGLPVRFSLDHRWYVHDDHLADRDSVTSGLVVTVDSGTGTIEPVGDPLAAVDTNPGFDSGAHRALTAQIEAADELRLGPEVEAALSHLPDQWVAAVAGGEAPGSSIALRDVASNMPDGGSQELAILLYLANLPNEPVTGLLNVDLLEFLRDHQLAEPQLDQELIIRLLDSLPDGAAVREPMRIDVHLLERGELLATLHESEL
jgi:hypothetical protein